MARKPTKIPSKAVEAWRAGDEATASRLAKLQPRQLRNRLGAPGRPPAAPSAVASPQVFARVAATQPSPTAPAPAPPAPESEPSIAEIEAVDTLEEARALLRDLKKKMETADPVRYASLAEKALSAINRIEQIEARRPRAPAPDEVNDRIRSAMGTSVDHLLRHTREAAAKLAADRRDFEAWCSATLAPAHAAEVVSRVNAMLGGA